MPPTLEALFELLFKYRPAVFEQGDLALAAPLPAIVPVVLGLVVGVPAVLTYGRVGAKSRPRDRVVLTLLRAAALALLLACLLRPVLVLAAAVPQRNTVAVLVDDSRSMRIADEGGRPRGEFVRTSLGAADATLVRALADRFTLRFYSFSSAPERVPDAAALPFTGTHTRIGAALDRVRQELADVPLAGVVLVSDGADNAGATLAAPLLALRARHVPVFTVGVGSERLARDIEVSRVEAPRTALKGSSLDVDVTLTHSGFAGEKVQLVVEDAGRIVTTRDVTLPASGAAPPVRVQVPATEGGARLFRFRVAPRDGEVVAENNERQALVTVRDRRERILYFEGEPRFEAKFLRRAVADDPNLQLVVLQRTADNKFLRLGVEDSLALAGGFPTSREELFSYRAIVLGSVEASYFTADQLRMLADFVGERGGGLLVLGGRRAFAEGGYAGTPLAEVIPVELDRTLAGDTTFFVELAVRPTPAGATHAALQFGSERESADRWKTLPPLTAVNIVRRAKPGATVLLTGTPADGNAGGSGARQIVFAYQRYGRGKAAAFAVQDSWLWQMHASIPVQDMTHELLWRQTLRWLVNGVPERAEVVAAVDRPAPGEATTLRAMVRDSVYRGVNGARVVAHVTAPSGARQEVPMEWSVDADGEYRASFTPAENGMHEVAVEAHAAGDVTESDAVFLDAAEPRDEYFAAGMRAPLLRRIAAETGGRFYTPATVSALPEDLRFARSGVTTTERRDLWDMPAIFLLLLGLVGAEWGYRRARGLA